MLQRHALTMKCFLWLNHISQAKYIRVSTNLAFQIYRATSVSGGWVMCGGMAARVKCNSSPTATN